jgi:hypothetical protein
MIVHIHPEEECRELVGHHEPARHTACMGLRTVLLTHGVRITTVNRLAWSLCSVGLVVSLVITFAQLSLRGSILVGRG